MTTPTDIEALRALLAAATPGPRRHSSGETIVEAATAFLAGTQQPADAALIVAAINALPALLDELAVSRWREDWIGDLNQELIARAAERDAAKDALDDAGIVLGAVVVVATMGPGCELIPAKHHEHAAVSGALRLRAERDAALARVAELEAENERLRAELRRTRIAAAAAIGTIAGARSGDDGGEGDHECG